MRPEITASTPVPLAAARGAQTARRELGAIAEHAARTLAVEGVWIVLDCPGSEWLEVLATYPQREAFAPVAIPSPQIEGVARRAMQEKRSVVEVGQDVTGEQVALVHMGVTAEDEGVHAQCFIGAQFGQHLIRVTHDGCTATRAGPPDTGPQVVFRIPVVVHRTVA